MYVTQHTIVFLRDKREDLHYENNLLNYNLMGDTF